MKYNFIYHNIKLNYPSWGARGLKIEIIENYGHDYYRLLETEIIREWFPMKEIFCTDE